MTATAGAWYHARMNRLHFSEIIASIVASSTLAACSPCPYLEVVSSSTKTIDAAAACDLMGNPATGFEGERTIDPAKCATACGDSAVNRCSLDSAYTQAFYALQGDGGAACPTTPATATLTCQVTETGGEWHDGCPIAGRRPEHLTPPPDGDGTAAAYLARCAHLEAAAVIAFGALTAEMEALGAPPALLADLREAEADEVRHTEAMTRLSRKYGAEPIVPVVGPRTARPAVDIAIENAVEGVVREAFGAAVALHQAQHAADPEVRQAFAVIADEECAHAALSYRVAAHLHGLLDAPARDRVEAATRAAIGDLFAELAEPPRALGSMLGLPSLAIARRMVHGLRAQLWSDPMAA